MRIAIAGAGIAGAYLHRLLVGNGHSVDIYDQQPRTRCGLTPCAWGVSRGFADLMKATGLDSHKYVLARPDYVLMDGLRVGADLMTIDKRMLIQDLLQGTEVCYSTPDIAGYERVIDATGVSRAFLPSIKDDFVLPCVEFRVRSDESLENRIKLGGIGYAWCFPLSDHEYHIGCGSFKLNPGATLKKLGWIENGASRKEIVCACSGTIRLGGPHSSQPFVVAGSGHEIWGVGEAIGCVAPLAGDGITPGMRSAQIMMQHWDDPSGYTRAILREFRWMKGERRVIDKLVNNQPIKVSDAWVLKKNARRMAMDVGLKDVATLLKHLR